MCGISGIYAFNEVGRFSTIKLSAANAELAKRGPDFANFTNEMWVNLAHSRLSIIDLNPEANQPMQDASEQFTIVFNGEIYNYRELRQELQQAGYSFRSESDTEVLLNAYIHYGKDCLAKLNGFFAFAIHDHKAESLFIARDRLGIKPLFYYHDEDKFIFASEMKALMRFGFPRELDYASLLQYLQLNYLPPESCIFQNVYKLLPGHYLEVKRKSVQQNRYYEIPKPSTRLISGDYKSQQAQLEQLLEQAVAKRMVADVPLGAFLSGGIDSSVITALASRHTDKLNTFSIGYREEAFFDETHYAEAVARKFNTEHTVFKLSNQDLYQNLHQVLDYIDEPFADSSALAVYILSQHTRQKATVALSGDGADELFSGYNKHAAEYRMRRGGILVNLVETFAPLWRALPKSRQGFLSNKIRQLERFAEAKALSPAERYWRWAIFTPKSAAEQLLKPELRQTIAHSDYEKRRKHLLRFLEGNTLEEFAQVLQSDLHLVLAGDMLTKVDMMSMANSLEVRVPFLDHEVVEFVNALPVSAKINQNLRKRILQDTFREILPAELYRRPKKGFEVPLLKWFRGELRATIEQDWLSEELIEAQGIFDYKAIAQLKQQLFSNNPGDVHARIWGLIVFQYWWKKYLADWENS